MCSYLSSIARFTFVIHFFVGGTKQGTRMGKKRDEKHIQHFQLILFND